MVKIENDFVCISSDKNGTNPDGVDVVLKKDPHGAQVMRMSRDELAMLLEASRLFSTMDQEQKRLVALGG